MFADVDISEPAALIGDPTRAAFLMALSEEESLPAGELARRAGVTASTASVQLAKLVGGGLVTVERDGRHRYYSLAEPAIAAAIESLAVIAPRRPASSLRQARIGWDLQAARTCYDHLAGALGVALFDALLQQRALTADLETTSKGSRRLSELGIDVEAVMKGRRAFARRCLDWSERRDHLAGALGAAIAARFFELGWIERTRSSRAVRVTEAGRAGLARELAVRLA
ncbi:MAG TPA: winged helix-turn-helix domain-containing protein [Gaiellaceae bacterium]|nr:winged helix-turn-helix domain-containing protein [Gaiellaceae bacterium]